MNITLLKAKIHRAVVTQADLNYVGSVTIDTRLLEESGIMEYEKVQIVDINNGPIPSLAKRALASSASMERLLNAST